MTARLKPAAAAAADTAAGSRSSTSERLKDAAIRLFATRGLEGVSVRDIAAAAHLKNAGSLTYYFRSKEELIRQLVTTVMGTADAYWKVGLDELLARSGTPTVRDVVEVICSRPVPASRAGVPSTARFLAMFVHSWGLRAEMRTDESHPPLTFYPPFLFLWTAVQFEDRGLHLFLKERAPGETIYLTGEEVSAVGSRPGRGRKLAALTHEIEWADDPHGQAVRAAKLEAIFSDGTRKELTVRTLPGRYWLKAGLYGGLDGWFHGDDKGKLHVAHERWDLADPAVRRRVRTLSDHVIEVTDGSEIGRGIMEYGVGEGYARYAEVQRHPPI